MLDRHEELIHRNIIPRLEEVEKAQVDFNKQVAEIQSSQQNLELTVMKDGQETRGILKQFVDHHLRIDQTKLDTQRDSLMSNERITLKRLSTKEKVWIAIIGGITGSSGLIGGIAGLMHFMK